MSGSTTSNEDALEPSTFSQSALDSIKAYRLRNLGDLSMWTAQQKMLTTHFDSSLIGVSRLMQQLLVDEPMRQEFFDKAVERMKQGYIEYGTSILEKTVGQIVNEQIEEVLDAVIYGAFMKCIYEGVRNDLAAEDKS